MGFLKAFCPGLTAPRDKKSTRQGIPYSMQDILFLTKAGKVSSCCYIENPSPRAHGVGDSFVFHSIERDAIGLQNFYGGDLLFFICSFLFSSNFFLYSFIFFNSIRWVVGKSDKFCRNCRKCRNLRNFLRNSGLVYNKDRQN